MTAKNNKLLSVVVPLFNEARIIDVFFERLLAVLNETQLNYEIVCVDDGSTDDSVSRIHAWMGRGCPIKLISLTRNFGKEGALKAGLDHAEGDGVIPIDADLQDPPEIILQMVEQWERGYEMVVAARSARPGDTRVKRLSASGFYRVMNRFSEVPVPANAGDFRLLDRRVVDALALLPERTRFHKGLLAWLGFKTCLVEFSREKRANGQSAWSYWRLWNYALDGIFAFSTAPLRLWSYIGGITACLGFAYALFVLARTIIFGADVPGYASLLVVVLLLNGLTMIGIGIVGEYVGRIFAEVKARPSYLVRSVEQPKATPVEVDIGTSAAEDEDRAAS